jgi:hypothetical protein
VSSFSKEGRPAAGSSSSQRANRPKDKNHTVSMQTVSNCRFWRWWKDIRRFQSSPSGAAAFQGQRPLAVRTASHSDREGQFAKTQSRTSSKRHRLLVPIRTARGSRPAASSLQSEPTDRESRADRALMSSKSGFSPAVAWSSTAEICGWPVNRAVGITGVSSETAGVIGHTFSLRPFSAIRATSGRDSGCVAPFATPQIGAALDS